MVLNGFAGEQYEFVRADVLKWLPQLEEESFDLIILDPPTFSNSKAMEAILDIQLMHASLINTCLEKLTAQGQLYFSTNARKFEMDAGSIRGSVKEITTATIPFDFKGKLLRWCYQITKG
jgi:23S rRNA (cytosine1962-C5)-methyltransferase